MEKIFPALVCPARWGTLMVCTDGSGEGGSRTSNVQSSTFERANVKGSRSILSAWRTRSRPPTTAPASWSVTGACCGGGGGVRAADPKAAQRIASRRVRSASDIADLMVSACPFCVSNLRLGNELVKVDIEIKDIAELVDDLLVT